MSATYRGPQDLRVIMGKAGERAAIGAFDALWMKAEKWRASEIEIPLTALRSKSTDGIAAIYSGVYHMTPDLWLPEHTALVECKASFAGRRFYATKRQFEAYRWAQSYAVRPVERPAVYYAFAAFEHPAPEVGEPNAAIEERLALKWLTIASIEIVERWATEYGEYGKDWRNKAGEVVYENFYRLTVDRVRRATDKALEDSESALEVGELNGAQVVFLRAPGEVRRFEGELPSAPLGLFDASRAEGPIPSPLADFDVNTPWANLPF